MSEATDCTCERAAAKTFRLSSPLSFAKALSTLKAVFVDSFTAATVSALVISEVLK